jgi:hypothetical protein
MKTASHTGSYVPFLPQYSLSSSSYVQLSLDFSSQPITSHVVKYTKVSKASIPSLTPPIFHLLPRCFHRLNDLLHNTGVRKRADISELVLLASQNLAQNAAHDLA